MANPKHVEILSKGVDHWNKWRKSNPSVHPDLSECHIPAVLIIKNDTSSVKRILPKKRMPKYDLKKEKTKGKIIDFSNVNFYKANLEGGYFPNANFEGANFYEADLSRAVLCKVNMRNCSFRKAYLAYADLRNAKIINANLNRASLVKSNLCGAIIENCIVYGTSAWGLHTDKDTFQRNLMIEDTNATGNEIIEDVMQVSGHYPLMVDDIEIAQFIHFITNYSNLGKGLSAMLEKGVLLLGKFKEGGREILESVAKELRNRQLIPIIFDFDSPKGSNLIETVTVLAGISRFIVANLNGSSVPAELTRITANFKRPIITYSRSRDEKNIFPMFTDVLSLDNVLYFKYNTQNELSKKLGIKLLEAEENFQNSLQNRLNKVNQKRKNA